MKKRIFWKNFRYRERYFSRPFSEESKLDKVCLPTMNLSMYLMMRISECIVFSQGPQGGRGDKGPLGEVGDPVRLLLLSSKTRGRCGLALSA